MLKVFQGETGGYLDFTYSNTIPATSGFAFVITQNVNYRFDGVLESGYLRVEKSLFSNNIQPGHYTVLPQVADLDGRIYMGDLTDVQVIDVPDFFTTPC